MSEPLAFSTAYYFGSFNPVHLGHLLIAQTVQQQLGLSRVCWVPAANPPNKTADALVAGAHRLAMLRLALQGLGNHEILSIELERAKRLPDAASFTVDTLRELHPDFPNPDKRLGFIVGSDTLASLPTWKEPEALAQGLCFLQVARPDQEALVSTLNVDGKALELCTQRVAMPALGLSATWLRERLRQGLPVQPWLPQAVEAYWKENNLSC